MPQCFGTIPLGSLIGPSLPRMQGDKTPGGGLQEEFEDVAGMDGRPNEGHEASNRESVLRNSNCTGVWNMDVEQLVDLCIEKYGPYSLSGIVGWLYQTCGTVTSTINSGKQDISV